MTSIGGKNIQSGDDTFRFSVEFFNSINNSFILLELVLNEITKELAMIRIKLIFFISNTYFIVQFLIFNLQVVDNSIKLLCATSIFVHSLFVKRFKSGH